MHLRAAIGTPRRRARTTACAAGRNCSHRQPSTTRVPAQNGILIKNSESLEVAHKINTIIFDKTGTITTGKPIVSSVITNGFNEHELLKITASLEKRSEHPVAKAILSYVKNIGIETVQAEKFESLTGTGLKGIVESKEILIGNLSLMKNNSIQIKEFESKIYELSENQASREPRGPLNRPGLSAAP